MKKTVVTLFILIFTFISKAQRNVILIVADDLGSDYCSFYDNHQDTIAMPHVSALLSKGVRFSNFCSNPVCSPTRAGILTGRYSFRTGVGNYVSTVYANSSVLDTDEITIPELLDSFSPGAISKAHIGKWHLQLPNSTANYLCPNIMGYDHFEGGFRARVEDYYNWTKINDGVLENITQYATIETVDNAVDWIKEQQDKPFFLWLAFNAGHTPFHLPPAGLYSDTTLTGTDIEANPKAYFKASIEAMDHEIGRFFDSLAVLQKIDSTDVIFIGDNGDDAEVAQSGNAKGTCYQAGVSVPLIIAGPSVTNPGRTSDALVNAQDLFATILELFGDTVWHSQIPVDKPVDSKSIMPIIKDTATSIRPWVFTEVFDRDFAFTGGSKAIRNMEYKLMIFPQTGDQKFFHVSIDTAETTDLLLGSLSSTELFNYNYLCTEISNLTGIAGNCANHVPAIIITSSDTIICSGTKVNFKTQIAFGGESPSYQWKKNGINVGSNSSTYSSGNLVNGDIITCRLITASLDTAFSNPITMNVNALVNPSITISASSTAICSGTNVTFTASAINGGTNPSYKWKKNGADVGANSLTYSENTLKNGNNIKCVLTSNAVCKTSATKNSNTIYMVVSNAVPARPTVILGAQYNLCDTTANYVYSISAVSNAISYAWNVPANATLVSGQGTTSIVVNYSASFGTGIISVQSLNYCGLSAVRNLSVYAKPSTPGLIAGPQYNLCNTASNYMYSISAISNATSYNWIVPANATLVSGQGTTSIIVNYSSSFSTGIISVLASNYCSVSAVRNLSVYAKTMTPGAITGPSSVCPEQQNVSYSIDTVPGATSYTWALPMGSSITSGKGTTSIVAKFGTTAGNITVLAKNACGSSAKSTLPITFNCRMNAEESYDQNGLNVINPFTDKIILTVSSDISNATVSLFDLTGREICNWKDVTLFENEQQQFSCDENIPDGIYLLTIKNSKVNLISKINHQ